MRTIQFSPSIRESEDGTLTLEGIAVPYDTPTLYGGMSEQFAAGAFDEDQSTGRSLLWSHDRAEPIGHITQARNTPDGLAVTAVVQPTSRGRDAITLLRSGSLKGLSVGFEPTDWTDGNDGTTYTRAKLHELSLTPLPAYEGAAVTATRQKEAPMAETAARQKEAPMAETAARQKEAPMAETAAPTIDLSPITDRMDQLEARMTAPAPVPARAISVREAFRLHVTDVVDRREVRALADVIGSGNSGILPPTWSSDVLNTIDGNRYFIPRLGQVPFPATGYSLTLPKITQHVMVAARGAEKSEIPSRALTTGQDIYTGTWYAGGADISQELISQSDPGVFAIVVQDLFDSYAVTTDTAVTLALETAATATGSALDFTSYKTFVDKVMAAAFSILTATGEFGNLLSLTPASWQKLIGLVDADGRRVLSTTGATNADGSAGLLSTSVDVGGVTVFLNPRATKDLQFNTKAAKVAEKPPLQVSSVNVTKMGVDVGILGAVMDIARIPAGIKRHAATTR